MQTDYAETYDLLTWKMGAYVLLLGALPVLAAVARADPLAHAGERELLGKVAVIALSLLVPRRGRVFHCQTFSSVAAQSPRVALPADPDQLYPGDQQLSEAPAHAKPAVLATLGADAKLGAARNSVRASR